MDGARVPWQVESLSPAVVDLIVRVVFDILRSVDARNFHFSRTHGKAYHVFNRAMQAFNMWWMWAD